jgi:hypothetical protein
MLTNRHAWRLHNAKPVACFPGYTRQYSHCGSQPASQMDHVSISGLLAACVAPDVSDHRNGSACMKNLLCLGSTAVLLLASFVRADGPYPPQANYGAWGGCSTCGPGCWATPGCCDRPVSKNDHLWDNYCQEKWCPTVDAAYLRPWWHAAPVSSGCAAPAPICTGPSCGTTLGPSSGSVNDSHPVSTHRASTPTAPQPADPPPPMPPPMPPARKADEPLQLKLLPLSRPRASQT